MATQTAQFVLPSDCTFTPGGKIVHKDTYERLVKLMDQAEKRDPDSHNMYIYNDFFGYALFELVDELISAAHTQVTKKKWLEAWRILDTIANFNGNVMCTWMQVDDGDRVLVTDRVYGAFIVATLRGLDAEGALNEDAIPDLDGALKLMASVADIHSAAYGKVVKGYGKKLFGDRTKEERERVRLARDVAWKAFVRGLSAEERKERGDVLPGEDEDEEDDEDEEEDEGERDKPWFGRAKAADADLKNKAFTLTSSWKAYRDAWAASPHLPLKGYESWDLSTWPADVKKKFSFDSMGDDFDDDEFY